MRAESELDHNVRWKFNGRKRHTWNWLGTSWVSDGNKVLKKLGVFGMVPVTEYDCILVVVRMHFG